MTLGERLREARAYQDMTQTEVSKKTGINNKTLSNWENDVSRPSPDDIINLSKVYGVNIDYILGATNDPHGSLFPKKETLGSLAHGYHSGLSLKEEREIESDLEDMMNSMASAAYEADDAEKEDIEALKAALRLAMMQAKRIAKKKYTPKKYRKD